MSPDNKHIDNLFRSKLGDYTETPPPAIWDALEERLDNNDRKRKIAPFYWLWYSLAALVVFIGVSIAGWNWNQKHLAKNDDVADKASDQDLNANNSANVSLPATTTLDEHPIMDQTATTKTDEVEVSYTVVQGATSEAVTKVVNKETITEADEYEVVKQELEHNIAYAESDRAFNAHENATDDADQISYGRKALSTDEEAPMASNTKEFAVKIIRKVRRKHTAPMAVKTVVATYTKAATSQIGHTRTTVKDNAAKSVSSMQQKAIVSALNVTKTPAQSTPKMAAKATMAQPAISVASTVSSKPAPHKPTPVAASAPKITHQETQQLATTTASKLQVKSTALSPAPAQPAMSKPAIATSAVAMLHKAKSSNVAHLKVTSVAASMPLSASAPASATPKAVVAKVVPSATPIYTPKAKKASIVNRTRTSSLPLASATSTPSAAVSAARSANKEANKAMLQPKANNIAKVITTYNKVKATISTQQPIEEATTVALEPSNTQKFKNRRAKTTSFRILLLASAKHQMLQQATNQPLQVAMQLLPIQKVVALPAKVAPIEAPAENSKLKFLKGFEIGVKAGFEKGLTAGAANRMVLAPYFARPITKKLSLMVQPAVKIGNIRSTDVGGANPYHSIDHSKDMRRYDSTLVFVLPNQDTIWRRDFFFSQTHDTIVRQQYVGGNHLDVELPILLKYQLTNKLSVYGGLNMSYGRAMGLKERTTYQATIVRENNQMFAYTGVADPTMEEAMVYNCPALNNQPQPAAPNGQLNFGYMLGVSYDINKQWKVDAAMQQMKVNENIQQGVNLNQSVAAPYFRITVGFKLFGK